MTSGSQFGLGATLIGVALALSGCGGGDGATEAAANGTASLAVPDGEATKPAVPAPTLAQGPDVCFRAAAKHLGAEARVSEITSFFSSGKEIDSDDDEPEGQMTTCTVEYQNPDDPRKLLNISMNMDSGEFSRPQPVEISVMGGDASAFKLEDYLIPLSQVNAAGVKTIMDAQKPAMSGIFSRYAWSGVRLSAPDAFSEKHTLRLDIDGRLASNDIKESGYASISTDGKTITSNHLKP